MSRYLVEPTTADPASTRIDAAATPDRRDRLHTGAWRRLRARRARLRADREFAYAIENAVTPSQRSELVVLRSIAGDGLPVPGRPT